MKNLITCLIVFLFFTPALHAQDIIYLKTGSEIKSLVIEINAHDIKYKKFDQQSGPLRSVNRADVFMIIFEDGTKEVIAKPEPSEAPPAAEPDAEPAAQPPAYQPPATPVPTTQIETQSRATTGDSAVLYIYRPENFVGFAVMYDIYVGDEKVGKVANKSKFRYVLRQEGPVEVWARTEKKESVFLDAKFGESYYIRCAVTTGAWVGHPSLTLVPAMQGEPEYARIKEKRKRK